MGKIDYSRLLYSLFGDPNSKLMIRCQVLKSFFCGRKGINPVYCISSAVHCVGAYSNRSNMEGSQTVSWHCSLRKAGLKKQKEIAHQFYFRCHSIHASLPNGSLTGGWAYRSPESRAGNQLASAPVPRVHSLRRQQVETRTKLKHSGILYCAASFGGTGRERVGPPPGLPPPRQSAEAGWGLLAAAQPQQDTSPTRSGAARSLLLRNVEPVGYFYMVFSDLYFLGQFKTGGMAGISSAAAIRQLFPPEMMGWVHFLCSSSFCSFRHNTVYLISAETKLFHLSLLYVWGSSLVELICVFGDFCDATRNRGFFSFFLISQESVEWVHWVHLCVATWRKQLHYKVPESDGSWEGVYGANVGNQSINNSQEVILKKDFSVFTGKTDPCVVQSVPASDTSGGWPVYQTCCVRPVALMQPI